MAKHGADIKECVLLDDHKNTCNLFAQLGGKPMHITEYTPTEFWLDELKKAV